MSIAREVVLGATAWNMPPKKYKKKKRTRRHAKKRLHIYIDESKNDFSRWVEVQESWDFSCSEAYIDWYHISRRFLH
jgi:hypothetical protein